ncbi:MAG: hypothetical protein E6Q98_01420 [Rhodospirillaceae bacterium]|nr:MAG: hypothetical protein E6Q98_01420 [Rhodospirillaceae bacterium]
MRRRTKQIKRILAKLTVLLVVLISLCHVEDMASAGTTGQPEGPVAMGLHGTMVPQIPQKGMPAEHMQCNLLWNINEPSAVSSPQATNARNPFGQGSDDWPLSCSPRPEIHPPQPLTL